MSEQVVVRRGMAPDEYLDRSAQRAFELLDGEILEMSPSTLLHSILIKRLLFALSAAAGNLWEVFSETTFVVPEQAASNWLTDSLVPDISLFDRAAFDALCADKTLVATRPTPLIPTLVAEVLAPRDGDSDVARKVQRYLALGVRLIWIVDPQVPQVTVYRRGSNQVTLLSRDDALTADDLLPESRLPLDQLFTL
ncbi:MAG: Uma2 family endonuclease [Anaerolineae bacterium]|nr:Uma2 family endonuclease [Anaerolineae bacterium]